MRPGVSRGEPMQALTPRAQAVLAAVEAAQAAGCMSQAATLAFCARALQLDRPLEEVQRAYAPFDLEVRAAQRLLGARRARAFHWHVLQLLRPCPGQLLGVLSLEGKRWQDCRVVSVEGLVVRIAGSCGGVCLYRDTNAMDLEAASRAAQRHGWRARPLIGRRRVGC